MNIFMAINLSLRWNIVGYIWMFLLCFNQGLQAQLFEEVSQSIGIDHIVETTNNIGGGVAIFDYDMDGDEDVYLTSGFKPDKLYRNNGDGTFTDVTQQAGVSLTGNVYTTVAITGDIDNDGDRDIFVGTTTDILGADFRNLLLRNNGNGTFTEIGSQAGFDHEIDETVGATFIDYDQDGFLDIYAVNYVKNNGITLDSAGMVNGFSHECFSNHFYHNNGDGTFTERGEELGLDNTGCSLAVTATDYDMDEDLDIYLANDFGEFILPNSMYQNQLGQTDTFIDVATSTGLDIGFYGMGIATGDYDQDGDFDYYVTNLGRNVLLDNDGTGQFSDVTTTAQVENTWVIEDSLLTTSWGTAFFDYDNDTYLDLFVSNGQIPASEFIATGRFDPNKLYHNNRDKTFTDISEIAGINDTNRGRGMAHFDFDNDGDLDFIVPVLNTSSGEYWTKFYENKNENNNNWLKIKLTGTSCNRDAFGTKIKVYTGDKILIREISAGASHASQHSSIVHFGLGADVSTVEQVVVEWLGGEAEVLNNVATNQTVELTQGGGDPEVFVDVTFQVDMNTVDVQPGGISLAADFDGWMGNIVMEDTDGDGVYSSTHTLKPGTYQYRFINGFSSSLSNWEQLSEDVHADCTILTSGTSNRFVEVGEEDVLIEAICYESCGACMVDPDPIYVTFQVDMTQQEVSPEGVFIGPSVENWEFATAMEDTDGDGIYSITQATLGGEYLYLFANGLPSNENNWEQLSGINQEECTEEQGGQAYRYVDIIENDILLEPVCFNACDACIPDAVTTIVDSKILFTIHPILTKDKITLTFAPAVSAAKHVYIYNIVGDLVEKRILQPAQMRNEINLSHLASGMYIIQVQVGEQLGSERIVLVR